MFLCDKFLSNCNVIFKYFYLFIINYCIKIELSLNILKTVSLKLMLIETEYNLNKIEPEKKNISSLLTSFLLVTYNLLFLTKALILIRNKFIICHILL